MEDRNHKENSVKTQNIFCSCIGFKSLNLSNKIGLSFKNAKNKNMPDASEIITAWWSIKGVPTDG